MLLYRQSTYQPTSQIQRFLLTNMRNPRDQRSTDEVSMSRASASPKSTSSSLSPKDALHQHLQSRHRPEKRSVIPRAGVTHFSGCNPNIQYIHDVATKTKNTFISRYNITSKLSYTVYMRTFMMSNYRNSKLTSDFCCIALEFDGRCKDK